jgi:hypothetical protein
LLGISYTSRLGSRDLFCAPWRGEMEPDRPVRRRMKHTNPTNTREPLILKTSNQSFPTNRISNRQWTTLFSDCSDDRHYVRIEETNPSRMLEIGTLPLNSLARTIACFKFEGSTCGSEVKTTDNLQKKFDWATWTFRSNHRPKMFRISAYSSRERLENGIKGACTE